MERRGLEAERAVVLSDVPLVHRITLADFQRLILLPLEVELIRQGRAATTRLVVYGPDFPTAITFDDRGLGPEFRSPGSLTGMTFLAPLLSAGGRVFTALDANSYADQPALPGAIADLRAFADTRNQRAMELILAKDFRTAEGLLRSLSLELPAPSVLYNLACLEALNGQTVAAEAQLRRAIDAGWMNEDHTASDPDLATVRQLPSWPELRTRMTDQWLRVNPGPSEPFALIPGRAGSPPGRLAMLLAPTAGRGLTVEEALANLERSVAADGTRPAGTVYFMASADRDRTGPRRWQFPAAAAQLTARGITAEIRPGNLPPSGAQVIGATIGVANFTWDSSGATMLPGAWCDHLTSFGGALQPNAGQTPLTAFLRAGAAGAGGAVAEPYNTPYKFPSAFIHLHRVRGLSLVEAVYRSLSCPYQYLVVGDPLSRPWPAHVSQETR